MHISKKSQLVYRRGSFMSAKLLEIVFKTHQIWCASTVPPSTPNMVFITHLKYCVQNGRYWSALHTHYGVCCTLDV